MVVGRRAGLALALAFLAVAAVGASGLPGRNEVEQGSTPLIPRTAFLAPANLADVEIAPDGKLLAFLARDGDKNSLWLLDTGTGKRRRIARHSEASTILWSTDSRWLFLQSERSVSIIETGGGARTGVLTLLSGDSGRSVLGVDRSGAAAMLVREDVVPPGLRRPSSYRVLRLAPFAPPETLFFSREPVDQFVAGGSRFARVVEDDHFSIRRVEAADRSREVLRCVGLERCSLLSSPKAGELLLSGDLGGDLERLLRLDGDGRLHRLHQDPDGVSDLANVALDPQSGEPVLASYRSAEAADRAVGAASEKAVSAIRRQLPKGHSFSLTVGRAFWLVAETGDRLQHPLWHLYDPRTGRLRRILGDVDGSSHSVDPAALSERRPVSFRASDGMLIHGFLTIAHGIGPASRLPLLVHVHGGPWSHAASGYSTMTQFLASRGYAVFEPNFRGSTGYGRAYMLAGKQDFGNGRVQQDIVEGARAMLRRGVGDPERVGIVGSSFGGYSALLGITFAPELFRVAVAGMPPADFGWVMRWQVRREASAGHQTIGLQQSLKQFGIDPFDPALAGRLAAQSPLANAAQLRRPLLIVAGGEDRSVPIRSVTDYAARLKALGRPVTLFVDPKGGHHVEDGESQDQFLYLVSTMLHAQLRGSPEPRLGHESATKLKRRLRIDDWALGSPVRVLGR